MVLDKMDSCKTEINDNDSIDAILAAVREISKEIKEEKQRKKQKNDELENKKMKEDADKECGGYFAGICMLCFLLIITITLTFNVVKGEAKKSAEEYYNSLYENEKYYDKVHYDNILQKERLTECTIEKVNMNKNKNLKVGYNILYESERNYDKILKAGDILYEDEDERDKSESYFIIYTKDNKSIKYVIDLWNNKEPVEGKYQCYNVKQISDVINNNCIPTEHYKGLSTC